MTRSTDPFARRAVVRFNRPNGATAVDAFTHGSANWASAWNTCERTGPAFQIMRRRPPMLRARKFAVGALAVVGAASLTLAALAAFAL